MRHRLRTAGMAALLAASLAFPAGGLAASSQADKLKALKQKLAAIQADIAQHQRQLQQDKVAIGSKQYELRQVGNQLAATEAKMNYLAAEVRKTDAALASTQRHLRATAAKLARDRRVVAGAVRALDTIGSGGFLDVLFSAQSFSDFTDRLALIRQVFAADFAVLRQIRGEEAALDRQRRQLVAERGYLAALASQERSQAKLLADQESQLQSILNALNADAAQQQRIVASDEGDQQAIEQAIQALASSGNGAALGSIHFIWPVVGPITSPFGYRMDPVMHQYWLHAGIDIGVGYGTPIHAAAAGTVILTGWVNGYGNTTVIDLGDGITNLYAHQERIIVHEGETVSQGQVIGYVGATGWATGPHLHFEIRVNGKPINPQPYLP
jgi:murein DD-endopeptidase MepM/ murein hydrolase activator NlpD